MLRGLLDRLYAAGFALAALALVTIAGLVLVQVLGRVIDKTLLALGQEPVGIAITSLSELGGFLFVGAVFLALAGTLRAGGHVRVTLLIHSVPAPFARLLSVVALLLALGLCGFALYSAGVQAWDSWAFNAVSFGMAKFPLWIPQAVMVLGLMLFWIALLDELIVLLSGSSPAFQRAEDGKGIQDGH
ncbi:TRAP-type C4-dicarboxylate transport system, small permease component [Roseovarius mucosus DSM 17069]|uniref:TRAP transporter small permease protein n=1 Tax=Roseovarius mucosus DSM 17069 TaxID=1288298 RepID=A0A0A0HQM9_9RHOB|nr:TRAP transporter small permease subunit [Roseovarius mucosus]KGM89605.1 TRAP-type C4-dicarboxylate transport system, small permease component [Roseovarius mucosus DSM 17069]